MRAPERQNRLKDGRGFTLIELLVATALVLTVMGAVAALAVPVRKAFDRGLSSGETVARARTAVATVVAEARSAGTGVVIGPTTTTLADVITVLEAVPPSSVVITRATGPQGVARNITDAGGLSIDLDTAKPCTEQDATCRVRAGDSAVIFDRTKGELITIARVTSETATLHLASPLRSGFEAGSAIVVVEQTAFRVRDQRLVRITAGGAEQPVADHVSEFTVNVARNRLDLLLRLDPLVPEMASLEMRTSVGLRK